jgi:hypothetical protein
LKSYAWKNWLKTSLFRHFLKWIISYGRQAAEWDGCTKLFWVNSPLFGCWYADNREQRSRSKFPFACLTSEYDVSGSIKLKLHVTWISTILALIRVLSNSWLQFTTF